jgi:hypothetical protein
VGLFFPPQLLSNHFFLAKSSNGETKPQISGEIPPNFWRKLPFFSPKEFAKLLLRLCPFVSVGDFIFKNIK